MPGVALSGKDKGAITLSFNEVPLHTIFTPASCLLVRCRIIRASVWAGRCEAYVRGDVHMAERIYLTLCPKNRAICRVCQLGKAQC